MLGIIIQARMGSNRLPGKILKKIGDKTLLDHIFYRLQFLKHSAKIVLATTINPKDNVVESFCKEKKIEFFRGSEDDVLSRYYECTRQYNFDHIVRLTGDNPFTDIEELDNLINLHLSSGADYTHSFGILPVGVGAEIFTFKALERSYQNGNKQNHREHVNEYISENPALFKISVLSVPEVKNRPDVILTIDTEEDYKKACYIAEHSTDEYVTTEKAIELCSHYA
jgi:spore coat polysaccharide biosynthesis protein SpsF